MENLKVLSWQCWLLGLLFAVFSVAQLICPWPDLIVDYQFYCSPILMTIGGLLSLILIYGLDSLKRLLAPMKKGSVLRVIWGFVLSNLIIIVVIGVLIVGFHTPLATHNIFTELHQADKLDRWLTILMLVVQIPGEELIMSAFTLPILNYCYFKNVSIFWSWTIANLIGCIIFMFLHLPAYQDNFGIVLAVGLGRYPFTMLWRSTNSLRGGIYAHYIQDFVRLVPFLF
ncbi:type II CAAX prenyl endopeptidase Rce1 family protein [Convivina intestini]|uniref:CPBP family glutamic-type intramembrane protease n=1 Tax=Convivina intestini TaxID=1505726 RepID=UPI00200DD180|nr:CPBP family glutamic-type intramembrane protease [Convivina intestini]CAH1851578.1 hypothetical protein R078131_00289 [Convivina intestini]